ncbi:hypothetical protein [Xanthobacter sediminis]
MDAKAIQDKAIPGKTVPGKTVPAVPLRHCEVRSARARLLSGDLEAARRLLAHSVALGHDRLALRRYFIARMLGADDLDAFEPFCGAVARLLPQAEVAVMAHDAIAFADRVRRSIA